MHWLPMYYTNETRRATCGPLDTKHGTILWSVCNSCLLLFVRYQHVRIDFLCAWCF